MAAEPAPTSPSPGGAPASPAPAEGESRSKRPVDPKLLDKGPEISPALLSALLKNPPDRTDAECEVVFEMLNTQRVLKSKTDYQKQQLCRLVVYEKVQPGVRIIREGETGDKFYMILSGIVDIFVAAAGRDAVTHLKGGQDFGEQALQHKDARRNATCVARTECELMTLNKDAYDKVLKLSTKYKIWFQRWGFPNLDTEYIYTEVNVQARDMNEEGGMAMAEALKTNPRAYNIDMAGNFVGATAGEAIGQALSVNVAVVTFNVSGNLMGDKGATAFGDALGRNKLVTYLNMRHNAIGDEGAKGLARGLTTNTTLITLDLSRNRIGDEGLKAICEALENNRTLVKLELGENRYTAEGAAALRAMQKKNTFITVNGERHRSEWRPYL